MSYYGLKTTNIAELIVLPVLKCFVFHKQARYGGELRAASFFLMLKLVYCVITVALLASSGGFQFH